MKICKRVFGGPWRKSLALLVCFAWPSSASAATLTVLHDAYKNASEHQFFEAGDDQAPDASDLDAFSQRLKAVPGIDLRGGDYWYRLKLNTPADLDAVTSIYPHGSYIESIDAWVFDSNGVLVSQEDTGYQRTWHYALHYGVDLYLEPSQSYDLWLLIKSRYYTGDVVVEVTPKTQLTMKVFKENLLIVGCIGSIIILALYNGLLFFWTRMPDYGYYTVYLISTAVGWSLVFGVFSHLFQVHSVLLMMLPFYLNMLTNTLFYQKFLDLKKLHPVCNNVANALVGACVILMALLPVLPQWVSYLFINICGMIWLANGLLAGILRWRDGFRPARFFVVGFVAVWAAGTIAMLSYFGFPRLINDKYLIVLLGQTIDVIMLAAALADRINGLRSDKRDALQKVHDSNMHANEVLMQANEKLMKALQLASESETKKDNFIMSIGHELRTPMNIVMGALEQAEASKDEKEIADCYRHVEYGVDRLYAQMENILTIAELDHEEVKPSHAQFSLGNVISHLHAVADHYVIQKPLKMRVEREENGFYDYVGDEHLLLRMLYPLVDNACKYTEVGEVVLRVMQHEDRVEFEITDRGPGIAEHLVEKMYERFQQATTGYQREQEGLGLGLCVSQGVARVLGTSVEIMKTGPEGSTFHVAVGMKRMARVIPATATESGTERPCNDVIDLSGLRCLIVEDNPVNAKVLQSLLKKLGMNSEVSVNGQAAVEHLGENPVDLIWMDLQMPVMDGFECARVLRDAGMTTPIIAVTANNDHKARARCMDLGMNGFISKPIKLDVLRDMARQCLQDKPIMPAVQALQPAAVASLEGLQCLIVEDNPVNAKILRGLLKKLGMSAEVSENGEEALKYLQNESVDLIWMDLQMPVMDGFECTQNLRESGVVTPIVAVTANNDNKARAKCMALGMNGFISKPVKIDTLKDTAVRCLGDTASATDGAITSQQAGDQQA